MRQPRGEQQLASNLNGSVADTLACSIVSRGAGCANTIAAIGMLMLGTVVVAGGWVLQQRGANYDLRVMTVPCDFGDLFNGHGLRHRTLRRRNHLTIAAVQQGCS